MRKQRRLGEVVIREEDLVTTIHKLNKKITITKEGCWEYKVDVNIHGYARRSIPIDGERRYFYVHRLFYAYYNGSIPEGKVIMHQCDNRLCCNPSHLKLGTIKMNNRDAIRKGRMPQCVRVEKF